MKTIFLCFLVAIFTFFGTSYWVFENIKYERGPLDISKTKEEHFNLILYAKQTLIENDTAKAHYWCHAIIEDKDKISFFFTNEVEKRISFWEIIFVEGPHHSVTVVYDKNTQTFSRYW